MPISTNQVINIAWMTPGIIKSSKKQLNLYKKTLCGTIADMIKYKDYRACLQKIKRNRKVTYYNEKCNEFKKAQ